MSDHGKKTRSPGFQPGNHWVICDRSGFAIRSKDAMQTWDGLIVKKNDWEIRHPQDFVRSREDHQSPEGLTRSETADTFLDNDFQAPSSTIPPGTFDNEI